MKILLDENLPHDLRKLLMPMHEVYTVTYMKWNGIQNGTLLGLAASHGFEAVITKDRGLEYEQNIAALPCSVVVVISKSNRVEDLRPFVAKILSALDVLPPKSLVKIS